MTENKSQLSIQHTIKNYYVNIDKKYCIFMREGVQMGYILKEEAFSELIGRLLDSYRIFAPVRKKGAGRFTDVDAVIYDFVKSGDEIELSAKSDYAPKEFLTPLSETLFTSLRKR